MHKLITCLLEFYIYIKNNGRTSDNVRPKSNAVQPNETPTGHSAQWEEFKAKLNVRPDYASVRPIN